ncbi:hypothetical protein D3C81_1488370 [compost metagenome]
MSNKRHDGRFGTSNAAANAAMKAPTMVAPTKAWLTVSRAGAIAEMERRLPTSTSAACPASTVLTSSNHTASPVRRRRPAGARSEAA